VTLPLVKNMKVYDSVSGLLRESKDVMAADRLIELKKKSGSNPWPVIEECIRIWDSQGFNTWKSYLVYIDNIKKTRKDPKYASTYDPHYKGYLRYTLDIPDMVMKMIRILYTPDELPMNREFFNEWARRLPKFKVAEKI